MKKKTTANIFYDSKESRELFDNLIFPIFENIGFRRHKQNSHKIISEQHKAIVYCMSAPSDKKYYNDLDAQFRKLRSIYGKDYNFYVYMTRDIDWADNKTYINTFKKIANWSLDARSNRKGILVGTNMSNLKDFINCIVSGTTYIR